MTERPLVLIAELTHRCPLRCAYCSNPVALTPAKLELNTSVWLSSLEAAKDLGICMVHFTGGEPLLRQDLEPLVSRAAELGLYTTLVTSGLEKGGDEPPHSRVLALASCGLRAVQVSFQGLRPRAALAIAGRDAQAQKLRFSESVRRAGLSLTTNFVLHKDSIDSVSRFIELSLQLGADRIELAHAQYHGWAEQNRRRLLPTEKQVEQTDRLVRDAKLRYGARVDLVYVMADYFSGKAKACMGGWGRQALVVAPDGQVLPCHAAATLPLPHDNLLERPLQDIWQHGAAFQAFRGESWLESPCLGCSERAHDFGGCRCQALAWAGRPTAADPACRHSPLHSAIVALRRAPAKAPPAYRLRAFSLPAKANLP